MAEGADTDNDNKLLPEQEKKSREQEKKSREQEKKSRAQKGLLQVVKECNFSFIVFLSTTCGIIYYGITHKKESVYNEIDRKNRKNNGTIKLYSREDKITYPVFFDLSLGLAAIMLGIFVNRCCLFLGELCHCKSRYNKDCGKVYKSCFGNVSWRTVIASFILIGIFCAFGYKATFEIAHLIFVVGGIGVGPFFVHLLNLHSLPEVTVSRILREEQMYPGYTLAWSYYFCVFEEEMKKFNRYLPELNQLTFQKIILLLSPGDDIDNISKLIVHDDTIQDITSDGYNIPTFKLGSRGKFAMLLVKEPVVALRKMRVIEDVNFVSETTYEDERKRFCKTLKKILGNAPNDECNKKGILVPVEVEIGEYDTLHNGGLVRIIMEKVDAFLAESNNI